ncbi:EamA/RhaT family transporter [Paenibacillus sp. SAF-054]|uniref:EamA/RhaT family transporter n=1 Tax=unclassified Paenibacillus TaxID=185978 RepID=UPI003F812FFD
MKSLLNFPHAGKLLMLMSAFCTATGQLYWKWGAHHILWLAAGFAVYGLGALLMIRALAMEKLSIAYPLMCGSYIFAMIYGALFLDEPLSLKKGIAVLLLIAGAALTSYEN